MKRSPQRALEAARRALIAVFLLPLRLYSRVISPALPARCRYYPTCSAYAEQAVREHGIIRGSGLAAWRLVRCNPFSRGGYDPVPSRHGGTPESDARAHDHHGHTAGHA